MDRTTVINFAYILASILFIIGLLYRERGAGIAPEYQTGLE